MELWYQESPWQQVNNKQSLFLSIGIWVWVSVGHDFYLMRKESIQPSSGFGSAVSVDKPLPTPHDRSWVSDRTLISKSNFYTQYHWFRWFLVEMASKFSNCEFSDTETFTNYASSNCISMYNRCISRHIFAACLTLQSFVLFYCHAPTFSVTVSDYSITNYCV